MTKVEDAKTDADDVRASRVVPMVILAQHDDDEGDGAAGRVDSERLIELYEGSFRNIAEGEVIKGTVLKVSASDVVVDVGYKSEGMIAIQEFLDAQGECTVRQGDTVDVLLERTEDRDGHIVLSREKAEKVKIWDEVEKALDVMLNHDKPRK